MGFLANWQKHPCCARRLEQHAALGLDPVMTGDAHAASSPALHGAAAALAVLARASSASTIIAATTTAMSFLTAMALGLLAACSLDAVSRDEVLRRVMQWSMAGTVERVRR